MWTRLRAKALSLPEAREDFPWGDCVAKVGKKIFVFLGDGMTDAAVSVKLTGAEHEHALSFQGTKPTAYNLGKAGWVTIPLAGASPALLFEWLVSSYCNVAPKRLAKAVAGEKR